MKHRNAIRKGYHLNWTRKAIAMLVIVAFTLTTVLFILSATAFAEGDLPTVRTDAPSNISFSEVTLNANITKDPPVLTNIGVTPPNPLITHGTTQQFIATGTYSDATNRDITNQVAWTSSNPAIALVNTGGLATGVGAGTTSW